jgi:hypothetical protein
MTNTKARKAALLEAGIIQENATGKCLECQMYPEVLDGHREASNARYTFDGHGYCGSHVLRIAEARETVFNQITGYYQAAPQKTAKAPVEMVGPHKAGTAAAAKYIRRMNRPCKPETIPGKPEAGLHCYEHLSKMVSETACARCEPFRA